MCVYMYMYGKVGIWRPPWNIKLTSVVDPEPKNRRHSEIAVRVWNAARLETLGMYMIPLRTMAIKAGEAPGPSEHDESSEANVQPYPVRQVWKYRIENAVTSK